MSKMKYSVPAPATRVCNGALSVDPLARALDHVSSSCPKRPPRLRGGLHVRGSAKPCLTNQVNSCLPKRACSPAAAALSQSTKLLTATSCTLPSLSLPKQAGLPPRASSAGRGTLSAPPIPVRRTCGAAETVRTVGLKQLLERSSVLLIPSTVFLVILMNTTIVRFQRSSHPHEFRGRKAGGPM